MGYNVRDILGHFVKPKSRRGDMCPHACCRGKRVHPANFPVILRPRMLRQATEEELMEHLGRHGGDEKAVRQVVREIDRRELADKRRAGARDRQAARRIERQELIEYEIGRAEKATNGYMVNKAGQRRGVTDVSLFTGSEARALRYASPELLRYWESHPRPSAGLTSANPRVVARARARSDVGRSRHDGGSLYRGIY